MSAIPHLEWKKVSRLYQSGLSMRSVAEQYGVSIDAVVYILRKLGTPRRSMTEANKIVFEAKTPSFSVQKNKSSYAQNISLIGATLYWAEGYKTQKAKGVDFANSDPDMVHIFIKFLRSQYRLDEKRLRVYIYCYADQDSAALGQFWSKKLSIPKNQFTNPYVRKDFLEKGRKMKYGLVHVRYSDKKLLQHVLNLIQLYKSKYASVV